MKRSADPLFLCRESFRKSNIIEVKRKDGLNVLRFINGARKKSPKHIFGAWGFSRTFYALKLMGLSMSSVVIVVGVVKTSKTT